MSKRLQSAVALKHNRKKNAALKVLAKGKGEVAEDIIKIAKEYDLPIKKDEDLIEILSKVEIDKEIPENLYKAVAEIFSFIYKITNENRA